MEEFNSINSYGIKLENAFNVAEKAELTRDFLPMIGKVSVGLSTGTSGNRGIFLANEIERALWAAYMLDRVLGISLQRRKIAFILRANNKLYQSAHSFLLQFHFFDLLNAISYNLDQLQQLQPTVLIAQPSMLLEIARALEQGKFSIKPTKVISVAEVLTEEDRKYLSKVFQQKIHQVYQCTEGFLASTCREGYMHFNEDFLLIEKKYLDDERIRFSPIITDCIRHTQPIIKYELDDILIEKKNCKCGDKRLAIESIEGRLDDVLIFENNEKEEIKIFPDFFRKAIIIVDETIHEYVLIQKSKVQILLFLEPYSDDLFHKVAESIYGLLKSHSIENVNIKVKNDKGTIPGNKLRRIRNDSLPTG